MRLIPNQGHVDFSETVGIIVEVAVARSDPRVAPGCVPTVMEELPLFDLRKRQETEKERGMPRYFSLDIGSTRLLLYPIPDHPYWFRARYHTPMKETD